MRVLYAIRWAVVAGISLLACPRAPGQATPVLAPNPPSPLPTPNPAAPGPPAIASPPTELAEGRGPLPDNRPALEPYERPFPINLATALQLANARPLVVQIAGRQVAVAVSQFDQARVLWLPNIVMGTDYFGHVGGQQNFQGQIVNQDRSTFMAGVGPNAIFSLSDAVFAPLASRQDLNARRSYQQAVLNDTTLSVAESYFNVQQARGELAGALLARRQAEELVRRSTALARGLIPPWEETRAKVELARRQQAAMTAREQWRTSSAELTRLLRLDPSAVLEPMEPPFLPVTIIDPGATLDALIPIALTTRPELAQQQAVVRATLARLRQERLRPLIPSLALRSASTNPTGGIGYGVFGGGPNNNLGNFDQRMDLDFQMYWEFQSLGLGNQARINGRRAERDIATLELFYTQDRIAAEVTSAYARLKAAADRLNAAEPALREAVDLVAKNLEGLGQTRRVGELVTLIVRPQEAVAAVQALGQANLDFYGAVADYNRAQFRLYRALGHPAQGLAGAVPSGEVVESGPHPTSSVVPSVLPSPMPVERNGP